MSDPRVVADPSMDAGQRTTWDCVWLGSYPQSIVTDAATIAALDAAAGWSASGDLAYGGATYRRLREEDATYSSTSSGYWDWSQASPAGYCYFLWEPVKWRVLEADGSTALVVADVALDGQRFHGTNTDVTWETCGLHSWLNGTFRDDALTTAQQGAVVPQDLANDDNIDYGTPGGNPTTDQVFLLSESDVWSTDAAARHGFVKAADTYDEARRCRASDYANAMGAWTITSSSRPGQCWWWLRSPGDDTNYAAGVDNYGSVIRIGSRVDDVNSAVRPALRISLSSNQISYAGTVSSNGTVSEQAAPYIGTPGGGDVARAKVSVPKATNRTYNGKAQRGVAGGTGYTLSGTAKAKNAGTYTAVATPDAEHCWTDGTTAAKTIKWKISKAKQPMRVKAVKRTVKASKLRKKAITVAAPLKFTKKAQGKVTYAKVAKGSAKCLTVNKKNGKVTVKRGTKKGTYKVKIKVTAKGNANYKAGSKTITCKVVVK